MERQEKKEGQSVLGDTRRILRKPGEMTLSGFRDYNVPRLPGAGRTQKVTKTS